MSVENYGQDGKVHMTYFDKDTVLSFVWDGINHGVAVSYGGYAEPVVDTFFVDLSGVDRLDEHFARFMFACQSFVKGWVARQAQVIGIKEVIR